jgi:hypothetical protein
LHYATLKLLSNSSIDDFAPTSITLNPYKKCANLHQCLIILPTYDKPEQMQPHISGQIQPELHERDATKLCKGHPSEPILLRPPLFASKTTKFLEIWEITKFAGGF